jgi:hypothetical protein
VGRHPNTSLHLTARTRGAFPKAVGAAGELVVIDNNKAIILETKKVNNSKIAAQMAGVHISASFFFNLEMAKTI